MLVLTNIIEKREIIITLDKKMLSDFEKKKIIYFVCFKLDLFISLARTQHIYSCHYCITDLDIPFFTGTQL